MKLIKGKALTSAPGYQENQFGVIKITPTEATPSSHHGTFNGDATLSDCANILSGFLLSREDREDAIAPFNLFCGRYYDQYWFEVIYFEDGKATNQFRRFSSEFESDYNELITATPKSFFAVLEYLKGQLPGYENVIEEHLQILLSEEQPYEQFTDNLGEILDYVYRLCKVSETDIGRLLLEKCSKVVETTSLPPKFNDENRFLTSTC